MIRNARGFTMMEMLVTVAVMGVLAAVAIPSVASRSKTFDMAQEGRRLHTDISRLRARAVAEQREYEVVVTEGHAVTIQRREEESGGGGLGLGGVVDGVVNEVDGIARTESFPEGSSVKLNGQSSGSIVFYPTGRVGSSGDIVLEDSRRKLTIRVLASGMTRMITETVRTADN